MGTEHFYTILPNERDIAIASYGYQSEGIAGYAFGIQVPGSIPLYRSVSAVNGEHFYTISAEEHHHAVTALGYQDEGIACFVGLPSKRLDPGLLQVGDAQGGGRFTDPNDLSISLGASTTALAPLYRLYHPGLK